MNVSSASYLVILLALLMANLPFVNDRLFVVINFGSVGRKSIWIRILELCVFYFILGAFAYFLESLSGGRFTQNWEFYAISACMFVVLSFPGFVFKYLRK
jgi:hypothetical protein